MTTIVVSRDNRLFGARRRSIVPRPFYYGCPQAPFHAYQTRYDAINFPSASVYPVLLHRALQEVLNRIFKSGYFLVIVGLEE